MGDPESKRFILPRDTTISKIMEELFPIPPEFEDKLPPIPDHILEARSECSLEFLEEVLLPRIDTGFPLAAEELAALAAAFKITFAEQHPNDLVGDFELLPHAQVKLGNLRMHYHSLGIVQEGGLPIAQAVEQAHKSLTGLLGENEALRSI